MGDGTDEMGRWSASVLTEIKRLPLRSARVSRNLSSNMNLTTLLCAVAVAGGQGTASDTLLDQSIRDLYAAISGPKGQPRDEVKLRGVLLPDCRLGMPRTRDGVTTLATMTVDQYISRNFPVMEREGFEERELARRTERFGSIAHIWSSFETRMGETTSRGINTIQCLFDGTRWRVVSILWDNEGPGKALPTDMAGG